MPTPIAAISRVLTTRPFALRIWVGLVIVPLIVMGLLSWAFWAPGTNHGTAKAAVVNNDEPVKVQGQTVPLGRQLAGDLTHDDNSAYDWVLTDTDDARSGLADGTYVAVVTIPKDFSEKATSSATAQPLEAVRGQLQVQTGIGAGVADPGAAERVAEDARRNLDNLIVSTYLDNVYVGFTDLHDQLGTAADGADKLHDGTTQLVTGSGQLADATGQLADGADQLHDGASQLADGTTQLADGASQLADGTTQLRSGAGQVSDGASQLSDGAGQLSDGLSSAAEQTAQLPTATRQLADGADQVADGNEQLADTVVPVADGAVDVIDSLPDATDTVADLRRMASECSAQDGADPQFCADLIEAVDSAEADAKRLDEGKSDVRSDIVSARDSVKKLATGARQVSDGAAELSARSSDLVIGIAQAASGASDLASGADDLADGASQLDTGVRQADDAAHQLADGADDLSAGADDLVTGAARLATGAHQADDGAGQLADGVKQADDGAKQLSDGLSQAVDQVPSYTEKERGHLSDVASAPTAADLTGSPFGVLSVTLLAAVALWGVALITYLATRPLPAGIRTSRESTWRIIVRAARPGAIAAASAALVISVIAVPLLDLKATTAVAFLLVSLLAAGSFVAINQALAAVLGSAGRLLSLVLGVLAVATGVVTTIPGPLYASAGLLPTHGAVIALRALVTGGSGVVTGLIELLAWLAIGFLATVLVTDRRRYLSPRDLRLGTVPSAPSLG